MKTRPFMRAAALAAALLMCGCATDISGKLPPLTEPSAVSTTAPATTAKTKKTTTTTTVTTTVTTSETTTETTTPETTPEPDTVSETISVQTDSSEPMNEVYKNYTFTEEDKEFISKCVFVGDSICMGLKTYEVLPATQVLAKGNVAARSIFEYTFKLNGSEMSLLSALVDL
ncbi:hypothetical protein, partial [Ruminococcus sp.]|uniref:hypothetical protein n=1 Tax=Ruminococcus sp. TaxID=41978 RepID=UPI002584B422